MKMLILYIPVLHRGYLELFEREKPDVISVLSEEVIAGLPEGLEYLRKKDIIRAVPSKVMCEVLSRLFPEEGAVVHVSVGWLLKTITLETEIVLPDEDVSVAVMEKYFSHRSGVRLISTPKLRYHRNNVEERKLLRPDRRLSLTVLDRAMMALAEEVAERSPDWWRQVGGVLVLPDGRKIVAYNEHHPHEQIAAVFGDPRSIFKSGVRADLSHSDHVEHIVVGEAARLGIPTDGSQLYLTTFPCLPCARLVARAGVRRIFYRDPSYGLLDADDELRSRNVELIEVSD